LQPLGWGGQNRGILLVGGWILQPIRNCYTWRDLRLHPVLIAFYGSGVFWT